MAGRTRRSTPRACARGRWSASLGVTAGSATTRSSYPRAGTRRWPSSPPSRRTGSATAGGHSGRWELEPPSRLTSDRPVAISPTTRLKVGARPADAIMRGRKRASPEQRRDLRAKPQSTEGILRRRSPVLVVRRWAGLHRRPARSWTSYRASQISFALFYLMPLGLVTWNLGRGRGSATALMCTVAGMLAESRGPGAGQTTWSRTGTRSVRFAVFIAFAMLLATLRDDPRRAARARGASSTRCSSGLREMNEVKDTLLHAVSHDLKGPLAGIIGAMSTIRRGNELQLTDEEIESLYQMIEQSGRKMNRLIDDMLDLERLDRGQGATRARADRRRRNGAPGRARGRRHGRAPDAASTASSCSRHRPGQGGARSSRTCW